MIIENIYNRSEDSKKEQHVYIPILFRLSTPEQKKSLENLLADKPHIKVFDTISAQLKELVKANSPSVTFTPAEIEQNIKKHLNGAAAAEYGVWVYYPWAERLVHILDEKEFVFLRTSRNKYKITNEEQSALSQKKIGVIGLSVGQSVSLTMAMERTFGELRIADFDDLEITNLNRLRSGIHNMGLLKTVLVAREIAEIDPYLKVTCFHEGITEENLDAFITENGKLDVLIDECDGVDIKIKCRVAAKRHGVPVLMEASDRATIDIERFDLEPDRPILHGVVEHLDISKVRELKTMEEKLPYILPIVGIETMSPRLKASAVEIGQTINTWPQLASAVTMGGGIAADICRRVLLDQLHVSGRYFIDIDELISDPKTEQPKITYEVEPLTQKDIEQIAALVPQKHVDNAVTDEQTIKTLVEAAAIAPSAGNNQPWKWHFDGKRLFLFDDPERSAAFANFRNMVSNLAMGSAIENMRLKAKENGLSIDVQLFPIEGKDNLIAAITVVKDAGAQKDELVNYLHIRHTNRMKGSGKAINQGVLEEIKKAALTIPEISIRFVEDSNLIQGVADIAGQSEKLRMFIPEGHSDLFDREIRWNKESAESTRDGLDVRTLDLSPKDIVGFNVIKDPRAITLVNSWNKGKALENMTRDLVASSSAVGLITVPAFTKEYCIHAGAAAERAWLAAAKHHLGFQPVLASVFHFMRLKHGNGIGMPEKIQKSFSELYNAFFKLFDLSSASEQPLFLFRLCVANEPLVKSLRLPLEDVYSSLSKEKR